MQAYLTLARRELGSFFCSWIGYVVIAGAMFLMGLSFVALLEKLQGEPTPMPLTQIFMGGCFWFIVLFSAPVITMRLFAMEKSSGTFETLMTTPVSEWQVVLAKFTAAIVFYMLMWLPLLACVLVLRFFARGSHVLDAGTLGGTYLGIFFTGCLYMAAGCFASALTRSQIVAAMIGFAINLAFFLTGYMAGPMDPQRNWAGQVLSCVSVTGQINDFSRGVVDTRSIVFCLTSSLFFLFLACRIIESRRWR
ncbi:MAG TPA: ABC transporter permease [Verrucomicrobiae bacterium]|jgi:ABC-2 type transport system permease protein